MPSAFFIKAVQPARPLIAHNLPTYICEAMRIWAEQYQGGAQDQTRNLTALAAVAIDQMRQHPDPKMQQQALDHFLDAIHVIMGRTQSEASEAMTAVPHTASSSAH